MPDYNLDNNGNGPFLLSDQGGGVWAYGSLATLTDTGTTHELEVAQFLPGGAHSGTDDDYSDGPPGDYGNGRIVTEA